MFGIIYYTIFVYTKLVKHLNTKEMNQETINLFVATQTVLSDFFDQCIKNGATPAQAEKEAERNQEEIQKRIKNIIDSK